MFHRHGSVRVALEEGEDFDARFERLVEAAFEADAEDFEQLEPAEGAVGVDVSDILPSFDPSADDIPSSSSVL